jgi:predicted RNase H-like nuclease (RuvC/YqgF family)
LKEIELSRLIALPLFGFFLVTVFVAALQAQNSDKKETKEDIIVKKLNDLQKTLDNIDKNLRGEVEKNKEDIKEIRNQLKEIREELAALKKKDTKLKELKIIESRGPLQVPHGKMKIINKYYLDQQIILNGETHAVKSGETVMVNYVPVGEFAYRVISFHPTTQIRTLAANETFIVRVYPQVIRESYR